MKKTSSVIIFTVMPRLLLLIGCIFLYVAAHAQLPDRAQHFFDLAMRARMKKENNKAFEYMGTAIRERPGWVEAYSILGEWYYQARMYSNAVATFTNAQRACKDGSKLFAKPLVKSYLLNYRPSEALQVIHVTMPRNDSGEWKQLEAQAEFMLKALRNPLNEKPRNLGMRVNSTFAELHPQISHDTETLYFTRRVNGIDEDFFRSLRDSCGGWYTGKNMGSPPNTSAQEAAQMISGDGHYLFFNRCEQRSENGWDQGGCDLFMAYRVHRDTTWTVPQSFGATINSPAYEGMPCLSPDNRQLYFVSDRPGGVGGMDIWVANFDEGLWQEPVNLGPSVNSAGNETAPFLHVDNSTLYFSSDGRTGMGGSDLFFARRINDTLFGTAKNMGFPINSAANEHSISITVDGKKAYFSSDRDSVLGNYDIYEVNMPIQLQPIPVAVIKGYAYDSLAKDKLNYTSIYVSDETGNDLFHFVSNSGDGSYMITLPAGANYLYRADRIGYLDMIDTIRLTGIDTMHTMEYNIPLLPQGYSAPVSDSVVVTIFFPRNSADLTDSIKNVLQQVMSPWLLDRQMTVLINGYTDNTGTPLINEQLSYTRAGLVAKALTDLGIDEMNMTSQGWGEAYPIAPNNTEEGRELNRRVEVIIRR